LYFSFYQVSYDPTEYVQKARVTKAAPPKPAYNPMQFVQIKPCNLYQTATEQLKKSEEVKKVKEVVKEDAEEWQYVSIQILFKDLLICVLLLFIIFFLFFAAFIAMLKICFIFLYFS
jgi:hypothetical protein